MKFLIPLILSTFVLYSLPAKAGDADSIISALKQANTQRLSRYFDNTLDIKILGNEEVGKMEKSQAASMLHNFFTNNDIKGFDLNSQRDMNGTMYLAGKLHGNKDYNITLMMKNRNDRVTIITMRINE